MLGLARSGVALARFLARRRAPGSRSTTGARRPSSSGRSTQLEGREVDLRLGPDVDPATAWAGAALVTTSPSINPDYPTTEPRLRAALQALVARAGRRRPGRPGPRQRAGPVPAPVPRADDRRHRDQGQDDDLGAGPRDPLRRPAPPGGAGREHRDPADRAAAGADAGPPRGHRAVRAPAADAVARHDRRRLHQRDLATTWTGTGRSRRTGGSSAGSPSSWTRTARSCSTSRTRSSAAYAGLGTAPAVLYRNDRPWRAAWACRRLDRRRRRWSGCRSPAAGSRPPGPGGGIMPVDELGIPGRHNVSNALAAIAVGMLFGVAPDAIRRAAAAFTGRGAPAPERRPASTACGSSTTPRAPSPTR